MKQVTVLFCDIVGSTELTDRLGAEAMHELVRRFLDRTLAEVHRYEGVAPQFRGDGFMALFGAPVTHEDHARRALLAALAIQRVLGERSGEEASNEPPVTVRIGIHTGPVVFAQVAESFQMETAIGDTAIVAARLEQAAEPGTILISDTTHRLAQGYARAQPVGPVDLKGKPEPIEAYRLLGISHRRSLLDQESSVHTTYFVDRHSELAILNGFLHQIESGHGQAIGIVGEPGIGKSRLLAEFRRQLAGGRVFWIEGRCLSYGAAIPYSLTLDLLRGNWGIIEADPPQAIVEKVRLGLQQAGMDPDEDAPVLLHLLEVKDAAEPLARSNPEFIKGKTFDILRQIVVNASLQRPVVMAFEDLHWIDQISEEFLGFLSESVRDGRILILATYRPGYRPPWIDKSYAGQTPLQPLSRDDSLQMVRSALRKGRLVELVTEEIVAKGDGNPFFLEQLALHAGEAREHRSELMVPDTIHDVVMARIDRLPEETKRLLQIAAVIGRDFSRRLLNATYHQPSSIDKHLRELVRLEFIYERLEPEGVIYVFRHALTQETAYGSLLERHRRGHHGDIGRALERLYAGRIEEVAELLAFHFGRSDETAQAIDYAILAAEKSQRRWANYEALNYFSDALRRLQTMPDTAPNRLRRLDAVLKQAEVKFALGRPAEHIEALQEIRAIVAETDDPRRRAAWHYWTGFLTGLTGARLNNAIDHCREAIAIASASGLEEIQSPATSCLAQLYFLAGRLHDTIDAGEAALSSFETRGDRWWAGRTLGHLTQAANALGQWRQSLDYCRRVLDHGLASKDLRLKAVGWWRLGSSQIEQGDLQQGLACCDEALALAPIPYDAAITHAIRGYGRIKAGQIEDGISELAEAVAWVEKSQLRYNYRRFVLWLAEAHLCRGDCTSARPLLDDVLSVSRTTGYRLLEGRACWLMADCLASDAPAIAKRYIENAVEILDGIDARNDLGKALITQAALRRREGDSEAARRLLGKAQGIFQALGTLDEPARVAAALAAL